MEKTMLNSEQLKETFQFFIDNSTDGYFEWDLLNPTYICYSPRFKRILGYTDEEFPNTFESWRNVIHPDDLKTSIENFEKHKNNPECPYYQEVRYAHKDGHTIWVICRGTILRDENNTPTKMIGTYTDITHYKEKEKKLSSKLNSLEKKISETQFIISEVSHNVNNILSGLIGATSLLRYAQRDDDNENFKYVEDIGINLTLISQLLRDLTVYNKSGCKEVNKIEKVNIKKNTISILKPFKLRAESNGLKFIWKFKGVFPKYLYINMLGFMQILGNLLDNAIKYTKDGKIIVRFVILNSVCLHTSVSDTGIGIHKENRDKIFQPFYREKRKYCSGSGIGLYTCKGICENVGGKIWFRNRKPIGTTFHFKFPINKSKPK